MKTSLVHFNSTDLLPLPGLLFEKSSKISKTVAVFLHGNGDSSVFYKPEINVWAEKLCSNNISFLAFNNRGAHFTKRINGKNLYGSSREIIKDCVLDIDGAINFLSGKGYQNFILIGHSTGANKAVLYNFLKPDNNIFAFILLAPGDDTGLAYKELQTENFFKALNTAKNKIDKGYGYKTVPKTIYHSLLTYNALYDVINPDGQYNIFPYYEILNKVTLSNKEKFLEFKQLKKPTLIVYGEFDEYCYGDVLSCMKILKSFAPKNITVDYRIIKDTNHSFELKETELGEIMSQWLNANLGLPRS